MQIPDLIILSIIGILALFSTSLILFIWKRNIGGDSASSDQRDVTNKLEGLEADYLDLKVSLATAQAENEAVQKQLIEKKSEIAELKISLSEETQERLVLSQALGRAESTLKSEREGHKEKLELLAQAQSTLKVEFQNTANKILEEKSERFTKQNQSNIENILTPLKTQLKEFKTKVEETYDKESKIRFSLEREIKDLKTLNERLGTEASNLVQALKGNSKTQGNWGELILERVLEESGLQAGREYQTQGSFTQENGRRLQPDVLIHLPEGKSIVVDAKVSLIAYERYCSEESDDIKEKALKEHIASVKKHVKDLSGKRYEDIEQLKSLDFILMFMPIESAFLLAMEKDQGLYQEAIDQNIFIVSPSNLLAMLRTISNIWRYEKQNQNAKIIAEKAGSLFDKFEGLVSDLTEVGKKIEGSQKSFDTAMKKLSHGRGNLLSRVNELKNLGAKTNKELPSHLLDAAEGSLLEDPIEAAPKFELGSKIDENSNASTQRSKDGGEFNQDLFQENAPSKESESKEKDLLDTSVES